MSWRSGAMAPVSASVPRSSRWQTQAIPLVEALPKGRCRWGQNGAGPLECAPFIQQDEVIAPSTNQQACSVDDI